MVGHAIGAIGVYSNRTGVLLEVGLQNTVHISIMLLHSKHHSMPLNI